MNYKLLFPTYRNRYQFVRKSLEKFRKERDFPKALNLGTGEGDYDSMLAQFCGQLIACDINVNDVAFAKKLNEGVENLNYQVENALDLSFPENHFDLLTSVDVLEHVGEPEKMIKEIGRILRPNGLAIITFPSLDFPFTYDPINKFLHLFTKKKISQGAYAFGHEYLISDKDFEKWCDEAGLQVVAKRNLSGYLIALSEMYWTGLVQQLFKANATNLVDQEKKTVSLRPSNKEPALCKLTDTFLGLDHFLFKNSKYAVGRGFILRK